MPYRRFPGDELQPSPSDPPAVSTIMPTPQVALSPAKPTPVPKPEPEPKPKPKHKHVKHEKKHKHHR